ncbi:MAG TPA: hypothetical protein ENK19_07755 [Acidobacteria bacterium]|nr:hypothetical protein [Acidobacteriota bacterium]
MSSVLGSFTALPNLHPALVHFPVALAFTALALDLFSLLSPRRLWPERAAAALYALAAAGAVAAYLAGRQAADGLGPISAQAETVLSRHADLGLWTMIVLLVAAVLRVAASVRGAALPVARFGILRALALLVLLGGAALVGVTADLGGALVFRHGVAVASSAAISPQATPAPAPTAVAESPEVRLTRGDDGALEWRPAPADRAALGTILTPLPGGARVTVVSTAAPGEGLALEVNGEAFLVLPGTFDNLVAGARLDLDHFKGAAGLAHHVASRKTAVLFTVATGGEARLARRTDGTEKTFDTAPIPPPTGTVELRTTAAGRHLKGFVDGKMTVHGHGSSGEPGRVGLYLNGHGTVRIVSISVRPAGDH